MYNLSEKTVCTSVQLYKVCWLLAWDRNDDVDVVVGILLQHALRQLRAHVQPRCDETPATSKSKNNKDEHAYEKWSFQEESSSKF